MNAPEHVRDQPAVSKPRVWRRDGGLLLLWSLAWSALALAMLTSYQPLLQTTRRAMDYSFNQRAVARSLAEAAANEALWYAQYGLLDVVAGSPSAYGCDAPWTSSCITKGAPLVDFDNNGYIRSPDITAAVQFPYHASHGWTPQTTADGYDEQGEPSLPIKGGSLTAGDGSGQVIGSYWVQVSRLHLPQPWIIARGCVPKGCSAATGAGATHWRTTKVVLERVEPQFLYAAFGGYRLLLDNHVQIDSYNSGLGGYGESLPGGGTNVSQKVRIGTNGTGSAPEVQFLNPAGDILVQGKLTVTPGTTVSTTGGVPVGDYVPGGQLEQQGQILPRVQVPQVLEDIVGYTPPPLGVVENPAGSGRYFMDSGDTWYCYGPTKVKFLEIGGEFRMYDGCQLLVDNGYTDTWGITTPAGGKITKMGTGSTSQIFVRNSGFNIGSYGASYASTIAEADRNPTRFQLFATCTTLPCTYSQYSLLAQAKEGAVGRTFYGLVYVEDGELEVQRGSSWGTNYNADYRGAFVAGRDIYVGTAATSKTVSIHWDEQARGVELDGTNTSYQAGQPYYRILSWQTD